MLNHHMVTCTLEPGFSVFIQRLFNAKESSKLEGLRKFEMSYVKKCRPMKLRLKLQIRYLHYKGNFQTPGHVFTCGVVVTGGLIVGCVEVEDV